MSISTKREQMEPVGVNVTADLLTVDLSDGRIISVPTEWFPRLANGKPAEWSNFELMFDGIHWPDLNEDIPIEGLLAGNRSGESPKSIQRWLDLRRQGKKEPIEELPLPPDLELELIQMGILDAKTPKTRRKLVAKA